MSRKNHKPSFEPIETNILKDMIERHGAGVVLRKFADIVSFVVAADPSRAADYADAIIQTHNLAREYEKLWRAGGV